MMTPPLSHRFTIDGEPYLLVEYTHEGYRQIQVKYAQLIGPAPLVLDALFYDDLYAEAVAAVCLQEAPAWCWQAVPPGQPVNGAPTRVLDLKATPRTFWPKLRAEVDIFRGYLRAADEAPAADAPDAGASPGEPLALAPAQAVPPVFRGQAV